MSQGYIHSVESFGAVDGPGVRFIIFLSGCPLRCKFCHNPDTWDMKKGTLQSAEELIKSALSCSSYWGEEGGITVSGGEPLFQIDFLIELFELAKKEKEQRKNQKIIETKEVRLTPNIDDHDFYTKVNNAKKFLKSGNKVKVTVRFRGREVTHSSLGEELLIRFEKEVAEVGAVDKKPKMEGRNMSMFVSPKGAEK